MSNLGVSFLQAVQGASKASEVANTEKAEACVEIGRELLERSENEEDVIYVKSFDKQGVSTWNDFVEAYEFDAEQFSRRDVMKLIRDINGYSLDNPMLPDTVALPMKFRDKYGEVIDGIRLKDNPEVPRHDMSTRRQNSVNNHSTKIK